MILSYHVRPVRAGWLATPVLEDHVGQEGTEDEQ